MNRTTLLALGLLVAALLGVAVASVRFLRQDHAQRVEQFAEVRRTQVAEAARVIRDDLEGIGRDLRVAGELMEAAGPLTDRQRELSALLSGAPHDLLIHLYDEMGHLLLSARAPGAQLSQPDSVDALMLDVAAGTLKLPPGQVVTTPPLNVDGERWFRVFATSTTPRAGRRRTVAILVDTEPLFRKLRIVAAAPGTSLLVMGTHGRAVPVTDEKIAAIVTALPERKAEFPSTAALVDAMAAGGSGRAVIPATEAGHLGLPPADVVVAYASIHVDGGRHWSIAALNSTSELAAQQEAITWRVSLAAGAMALALLVIALLVLSSARRAAIVRERLRHAETLAHLHEKTEKILDTIPTGVLAMSASGVVTSANRILREKLGSDVVQGPLDAVFHLAPAPVVGRLRSMIDAAIADGRTRSLHGERLSLFGHEGQYGIHAVPLEARYPEARALLVIEDQTEVTALESQLLRAEKLSTVGVLAAGIAHEIGTPLSIVRGRARLVLQKLGAENAHASGVRVIIEQIDLVTRIIRQLLDFSRVRPPQVHAVSLGASVLTVAELLRFEAERRKVTLATDVEEHLPPVQADPDQVQQLLVNLVMNALDASPPGGTVTVRARSDAASDDSGWSKVRLSVVDTGCGIPDDQRAKVFDPFFTTKKRGQGTGLGLAVTAQIVRNHGATIELDSEPGKGTTVTVLWPVSPVKEKTHGDHAQGPRAAH